MRAPLAWKNTAPRLALGTLTTTLVFCGAAAHDAGVARAAEPAAKTVVMMEPGDVTDVADAFDDDNDDDFDFSVGVQFEYLSKSARILRESAIFEPGLTTGGYTSRTLLVGQYSEVTSRLTPRIDIGIYKDLALYAKLPITLSNSRKIDAPDGAAGNVDATLGGAPGEQLFGLPFKAPSRGGVERIIVGIDWGIFNQARDNTKPTWVFGVEAQLSAGDAMNPCNGNLPDDKACTHPGDIDRSGDFTPSITGAGGIALEAEKQSKPSAGITDGLVGLQLHTLMSKRIKYIEPYGGIQALVRFRQTDSGFNLSNFAGTLVNTPPVIGTVLLGMMVHPWENREEFGRITLDFRFQGEYHSEGRDYSELYDALGSSAASSLRNPKWARFKDACPGGNCTPKSVVDTGSQKAYFAGLTVVEPFGSYRAASSITWRANTYMKVNAGFGVRFDQPHGITHDQPCNPNFKDDVGVSGPCHNQLGQDRFSATGIPNPAYRPTINAVGRRFYVDESITYEVFAKGVVMF